MPETKGIKDGNTTYTYVDEVARNLANPPEGNPGDVLTRTETGTEWAAPSGSEELIVITADFDDINAAFTAGGAPVANATVSHTVDQILAAKAAGKRLRAVLRITDTDDQTDPTWEAIVDLTLTETGSSMVAFAGDSIDPNHSVNEQRHYFALWLQGTFGLYTAQRYYVPNGGSTGDVLTKGSNGFPAWAPPQGGGDDDAFEVVFNASLTAITSAEVGEPVTATANHTTAEIDAAFAAGKSIAAKIRLTATVGSNELETVVNVFNIARVAANGTTHTTFTALWVATQAGALAILNAVFGPDPMVAKGGEIVPA